MAKREDELRLTCRLYLNEEKGQKTLAMMEELLSTGKYSNRNDLLVEAIYALYEKVIGKRMNVQSYMDEAKRLRILADKLGPVLAKEMETQLLKHDTRLLATLARSQFQQGYMQADVVQSGNGFPEAPDLNHGVFLSGDKNKKSDKEDGYHDNNDREGKVEEDEKKVEGELPTAGAEPGENAMNYMSQLFGNQD